MRDRHPHSGTGALVQTVIFVGALLAGSLAAAEEDCRDLYREHLARDLSLPYQRFDQTEGQGFRVLAEKGCAKEAADLIEAYIKATGAGQSSLRWHVAQLRATAGNSAEAIRYARTVLSEKEDFAEKPLRWNDYVLATIAFLQHDREALVRHRDEVARGKAEYFGNELNLKLLDSLIKYFDRDYAYATEHIGQ